MSARERAALYIFQARGRRWSGDGELAYQTLQRAAHWAAEDAAKALLREPIAYALEAAEVWDLLDQRADNARRAVLARWAVRRAAESQAA